MICQINVSVPPRRIYEIKRHYHSGCHLRQDQRYRERYSADSVRGKVARVCMGPG